WTGLLRSLLPLVLLHRLVADRLRHGHLAVGQIAILVEVIDQPVGGGHGLGNFGGLVVGQVEHLHAPAGDLDGVVVPVLVPVAQRHLVAHQLLGVNPLHLRKLGVGIGGIVDQAHDLRIGVVHFAIVMVGAHFVSIHQVWRDYVDVISLGWTAWRSGL